MAKIARFIESHADEPLPLSRLAAEAGLSPSRLQRVFKSILGVSPKAYQDALRRGDLKTARQAGERVTDAIFEAGFGSWSRVHGDASRNIGMAPSAYRAKGAGETIAWVCRSSVLGPLMMGATDRGVCFVQFGASEPALLAQLHDEFEHADIVPSASASDGPPTAELDRWMDALDAHLRDSAPRPELPLDLRGTAFQVLVRRFLLSIKESEPCSTRSEPPPQADAPAEPCPPHLPRTTEIIGIF